MVGEADVSTAPELAPVEPVNANHAGLPVSQTTHTVDGTLGQTGFETTTPTKNSVTKVTSFSPVLSRNFGESTSDFPTPALTNSDLIATRAREDTASVPFEPNLPASHGAIGDEPRSSTPTSQSAAPLPFEPRRAYDGLTPNLTPSIEGESAPRSTGTDTLITAQPSPRAVLHQALAAVQNWMSTPAVDTETHRVETPRVQAVPAHPQASTTFLPNPQKNVTAAMVPRESSSSVQLPQFDSAPKLTIGRVEIEIVRPHVTPPSPKLVPTVVRSARAPVAATPSGPRSSALDAKRNFGMRQR
jgi:hypothetical protein